MHTDGVVDDHSSSNFELLHPIYWVQVYWTTAGTFPNLPVGLRAFQLS